MVQVCGLQCRDWIGPREKPTTITETIRFYAANLGGTNYSSSYKQYVIGNCTWYAYARASEMNGKWINSNFRWSASKWWDINKQNRYYPYGSTPKVGAIACYSNHVAVVEKVVNGKPYVSESGWKPFQFKTDFGFAAVFSLRDSVVQQSERVYLCQ